MAPKMEPDLEPEMEPDLEPDLDPEMVPDLEPDLGPEMEPDLVQNGAKWLFFKPRGSYIVNHSIMANSLNLKNSTFW